MDKLSLERANEAHPKIRQLLIDTYTKANNKLGKGCRLRLSYVYRSPEEQDALYAQGRTKKGVKVTNSKAWQSTHQFSFAFDIVLMYDKDEDGKFEEVSWDTKRDGDKDGIPDWLEVTTVFVNAGYSNGFITNGKKWDLPHFQKNIGLTVKQMKSKIDSGQYTEELQNGKKIKYIKLNKNGI